jgi:hypothetical protein
VRRQAPQPAEVDRVAHRIALALGLAVTLSLAGAATGCSTSSNPVEDASEDAAACAAAGGTCVPSGGVALCPNAGPKVCGAAAVCCVLVSATIRDASAE